jgi:hypothetical protein
MKRFIISLFVIFFVFSALFVGCLKPWWKFDRYTPPVAPDYSRSDMWACLPWIHNASDTVPPGSGLKDDQANAKVDVFFVYPTLDLRTTHWNADPSDGLLNKIIEKTSIRSQAGVFNGSCRVFAPRYRQAVFASFFDDKGDGTKALTLAYNDVATAFQYYMKHYNNGRPVIIAGHSQGCLHALHLVKEFFDTTALKKKLVVAYLVGFKVTKDSLKELKPCDSAKQTGCYVTWNTISKDGFNNTSAKYFSGVCINPLSWKQDSNYMASVYNLGSVDYKFGELDKHEAGAVCRNGLLVVDSVVNNIKYKPLRGSYHIFDYNLFYMNIRANIADRVNEYFRIHPDSLSR